MIHDNMHALIVDKQQEIRNRYKIYISISDIVTVIIENGIDNIEKLLGLENEL
jgi:hypothetical protein